MVKRKDATPIEYMADASKDINRLEQENVILRQKLADETKLREDQGKLFNNTSLEMKRIREKGKKSANRIEVVEKNDHKNISLWTKYGKRIGPMHPDNAIQTLNTFADIGVYLTANQPTQAEIDTYKDTYEYKEMRRREIESRKEKEKTKRSGAMERMSAEIAKMSGTTVEAINHIVRMSEVGKK